MSPSGRTVLFFLDSLALGGVERIVLNTTLALSRMGWSVEIALNQARGELLGAVAQGTPVHDLGARRFHEGVAALAKVIRARRPAIVVSQRAYLNAIAVLAVLVGGPRTKLVLAEHSLISRWLADERTPKRRVDYLLARVLPLLYLRADAIVAISRGVAADLEKLLGKRPGDVRVLYNPLIDEARADRHGFFQTAVPARADGPPLVVGVGRLSSEKDFGLLIRAFALVRQRLPARLAIVGSGPELGRLQALAASLGLADHVDFPGFQEDSYAWLRCASVFALSSVIESFPSVVIESMAVGTPVVAVDCPEGPREIINDGKNGLIVPAGDAAALADGIVRVLEDRDLAAHLAANGRVRAADFTFGRTIRAYTRLFEDLLPSAAPQGLADCQHGVLPGD